MNNEKILYIEDNEVNRKLVRRILEREGYTVIEAVDGLSGVRTALSEKPDLILMDINLPGLDGHEAATRLKSEPTLADTPIVALTANVTPGDHERSLVSGCDGYIPKPINPMTFASQIRPFLQGERESLDEGLANYYLREYRDKLVNRLQAKIEELTRLNAELEQQVEERTRELRAAQAQLVRMEQKKALIQLAEAVAHELRQPQTVITGLIGLITSDGYDQSQLQTDLQAIVEQVRKMSRLIDSLTQLRSYQTKDYGGNIRIVDLEKSARKDPEEN